MFRGPVVVLLCLAGCSIHRHRSDTHTHQHSSVRAADASIATVGVRPDSDASPRVAEDASLHQQTRVVGISVGAHAVCVLLEGGRVSCFGDPSYAELGSARPRPPCELGAIDFTPTVRELRAGGDFFCVRADDDSIACWGDNHALACGIYNRSSVSTPTLLGGLRGRSLVLSSSGGCVMHETGLVYCWGAIPDSADRRSADVALPTPLAGLEGATHVLFPNIPLCLRQPSGIVRCSPRNAGAERRLTNWISHVPAASVDALTFGTDAICTANQQEVRVVYGSGEATSMPMSDAVAVGCTSATVCGLSRDSLRCAQDGTVFHHAIRGGSVLGVGNGIACVWGETLGLLCVELQHRLWLSTRCQARQTERGIFTMLPAAR